MLLRGERRRSRPRARACRCAASCASRNAPPGHHAAARMPRALAYVPARHRAARGGHLPRRPSRPAARVRPRRARRRRGHARRARGDRADPRRPTTARSPSPSWPTTRSRASSRRCTTASPTTSRPRSTSSSSRCRTRSSRASGWRCRTIRAACGSRSVYDGSPASRARLVPGDLIVAVGRTSLRGQAVGDSTALIKGPPGHRRDGHGRARRQAAAGDAHARDDHGAGRGIGAADRRAARSSRSCALATFATPGAHAQVYAAVKRRLEAGGEGHRAGPAPQRRRPGEGGAAGRQRVPAGGQDRVDCAGAASRRRRSTRPATRSRRRRRSWSSSTATPPRRRRSSPARCRTTTARRSSGTRTFGKGVFQEVIELDNGGALDITAGQYFTPSGATSAAAASSREPGLKPDVERQGQPEDHARRGARTARCTCWPPRSGERPRPSRVLEKRGRFLVGIPFFPRHAGDRDRSIAVDRHRDARPGRLVVLASGSGRAKIERVLGRPDVARDVIEALMIDRGLMRRFPAGVERAAKEAIETVRDARDREDLRDLPTFTIDPVTAKDFDDAISAQELGAGALADLGPHRRRQRVRAARRGDRPRGLPALDQRLRPRARSSRCCPSRCPTARARSCPARSGWP